MAGTTFGFRVREQDGEVRVAYGVNDDPMRWGFGLLGLDFEPDVARGFPVLEATVVYPGEGYAAYFGWIQLVRYWEDGGDEPTVMADMPPQVRDIGMPYAAFGTRPVLFDAPAFDGGDVRWRAATFLTFTPDGLMTPVVEPACGFTWGYDLRAGAVTPTALLPAGRDDWLEVRREFAARFPAWTFGGAEWRPSEEDAPHAKDEP